MLIVSGVFLYSRRGESVGDLVADWRVKARVNSGFLKRGCRSTRLLLNFSGNSAHRAVFFTVSLKPETTLLLSGFLLPTPANFPFLIVLAPAL